MGKKTKLLWGRIKTLDEILTFGTKIVGCGTVYGGVIVAALYTAWSYFFADAPLYALPLIFLGAAIMVLAAIVISLHLWGVFTTEKLDEGTIGNELVELSRDMSRWIVRAGERNPEPRSTSDTDAEEVWYARGEWDRVVSRDFADEFGPQLMAAHIILGKLGLELPFHLSHVSSSTMMGIASYLGAMGSLLKDGRIEVAREMDETHMFRLSNLVR